MSDYFECLDFLSLARAKSAGTFPSLKTHSQRALFRGCNFSRSSEVTLVLDTRSAISLIQHTLIGEQSDAAAVTVQCNRQPKRQNSPPRERAVATGNHMILSYGFRTNPRQGMRGYLGLSCTSKRLSTDRICVDRSVVQQALVELMLGPL